MFLTAVRRKADCKTFENISTQNLLYPHIFVYLNKKICTFRTFFLTNIINQDKPLIECFKIDTIFVARFWAYKFQLFYKWWKRAVDPELAYQTNTYQIVPCQNREMEDDYAE